MTAMRDVSYSIPSWNSGPASGDLGVKSEPGEPFNVAIIGAGNINFGKMTIVGLKFRNMY
jgi:hypothetical protein